MSERIQEYLRNNPNTTPPVLMRKFSITYHHAVLQTALSFVNNDNEINNASPTELELR